MPATGLAYAEPVKNPDTAACVPLSPARRVASRFTLPDWLEIRRLKKAVAGVMGPLLVAMSIVMPIPPGVISF